MKKSGMSRRAFLAIDPAIIDGGGSTLLTKPNAFYLIIEKAPDTALPAEVPLNVPFKTPDTGIQLKAGDRLFELDMERYCKTNASFSFAQGTIDAGDDCTPGAKIRDGITTASGNLDSFLFFDEATEQLVDVSKMLLNLFISTMDDDGQGGYSYNPASDPRIYLGLCLNEDAKADNIENWVICPIVIPSLDLPGGNTDMQSMSVPWELGDGIPVLYNVPRAA